MVIDIFCFIITGLKGKTWSSHLIKLNWMGFFLQPINFWLTSLKEYSHDSTCLINTSMLEKSYTENVLGPEV